MGYESKLFIVHETEWKYEDLKYAEVIGMFDICKCPGLNQLFKEEANAFILDVDGNTEISEDRYGAPLRVAEMEEVKDFLEEVYEKEHYWRAKVGADMLKSCIETPYITRDNLKVYHFGY